MSLKLLEEAAGITDRAAFWAPFAKLDRGTAIHMDNGKMVSAGFKAGVKELRRLAAERTKKGANQCPNTASS